MSSKPGWDYYASVDAINSATKKIGSMLSDAKENDPEYYRELMGIFKPDERLIALDEKLSEYYRETENCDNRTATQFWVSFKMWCLNSGYSLDEINRAKLRVTNQLGI